MSVNNADVSDIAWNFLSTAGSVTSLVVIDQGDSATTMDGRKCVIRKIHVRLKAWMLHQGTVNTPTLYNATHVSVPIRVVLVLDRQANGALPATTDRDWET